MLYCLPLEPMHERYTEQWFRWFAEDCHSMQIPCEYIVGNQLDSGVEVGTVLDAAGTNFWKMIQVARVCELFKQRKIRDGDVFFSTDAWHPGFECIPYMVTLYGLDVKCYAFVHAGSYTTEDFAAPMAPWAQWFEKGWYAMCDGWFTGTYYHKDKFIRFRGGDPDKLHVTGYPIRLSEMPSLNLEPRENVIIFSHRWDKEKRPDRFVKLMCMLWEDRKDFRVVITTSRKEFRSNDPDLLHILDDVPFPYDLKVGISKQEYYQELNKAKVFVSTTIEEGFGYCLVESMAMGVTPVVVYDFSHPEITGPMGHLFSGDGNGVYFCDLALREPDSPTELRSEVAYYGDSFKRMIRIMRE